MGGFYIGRERKARKAYGFDEVALVPGDVTLDPDDVDISWKIGNLTLEVPILASAMDGVVDTNFAIQLGKLGGLAVLNLTGIQTRYENPAEVIEEIVNSSPKEAVRIIQRIYKEPIKEELIEERIKEVKKAGVPIAVSCIPQQAARFGPIAQEAGADVFVVQATVVTAKYKSSKQERLDFTKFCKELSIPVIAGNCVSYRAAYELMQTGIDAILVGVGPGAACTTREVLGVGVPQVTATIDVAAARDDYFRRSGRYVSVITDGGMRTGGDICKALAAGADAVMIGSAFARAKEAPGKGYHWGMATSDENLPRGARIKVGTTGTLKEILYGPARLDDGSQNLIWAIRTCMGYCGVTNIKEMHEVEMVIAPAIKSEGKFFQRAQRIITESLSS
ncbi:GuaB3 family IMP dehydrogenase-related protein [Candidatus Aerophobetes bacterium]|uniref:GuaB3 family IMP dehydrogenase-related protein n=1 Tax=Aerophobetes bacterium TaxID=2030807 RepID=A0A497E4F2_UNCAE|nr:GuaB3 family IMP dehydrogenase-related protein [Candidatus Aerophobetes bacterium]RLE09745.1 MAG: GuaB3 family IMP dehydrogenase-related protein [Candidatus Aerophobetes bacterium]